MEKLNIPLEATHVLIHSKILVVGLQIGFAWNPTP